MTFMSYGVVASIERAENPISIVVDEALVRQRAEHALAALQCIAGGIVTLQLTLDCQFLYRGDYLPPEGFIDQLKACLADSEGPHLIVSRAGHVNLQFQFPENILITVPMGFSPPLDRERYKMELLARQDTAEHALHEAIEAATAEAARTTVRH